MMRTKADVDNSREASVCYWIHNSDEREIYSSGYVGITTRSRFDDRMKEHRATGKCQSGDTHIIIGRGTPKMVLAIEKHLRPRPRIGRNIRAGGNWMGFMKLTPEEKALATAKMVATKAAKRTPAEMARRTARRKAQQESRIPRTEYNAEYHESNKVSVKARRIAHREANIDEIRKRDREYGRAYRKANIDKVRKLDREAYAREKARAISEGSI